MKKNYISTICQIMDETWPKHPIKLIGQTIDLLSLEESHLDLLSETAKDKRIWELTKHYPSANYPVGPPQYMKAANCYELKYLE
jgi:hypothetical protein